jgi:LuxR family maltose regulon positive regulatory protein
MAHSTPKVQYNRLYLADCSDLLWPVESPAWFDWLQSATAFRYHSQRRHNFYRGNGPLFSPISVRKEKRRRGFLWYAYLRSYGILYKRYVGKSEALTIARLEEIALALNQVD